MFWILSVICLLASTVRSDCFCLHNIKDLPKGLNVGELNLPVNAQYYLHRFRPMSFVEQVFDRLIDNFNTKMNNPSHFVIRILRKQLRTWNVKTFQTANDKSGTKDLPIFGQRWTLALFPKYKGFRPDIVYLDLYQTMPKGVNFQDLVNADWSNKKIRESIDSIDYRFKFTIETNDWMDLNESEKTEVKAKYNQVKGLNAKADLPSNFWGKDLKSQLSPATKLYWRQKVTELENEMGKYMGQIKKSDYSENPIYHHDLVFTHPGFMTESQEQYYQKFDWKSGRIPNKLTLFPIPTNEFAVSYFKNQRMEESICVFFSVHMNKFMSKQFLPSGWDLVQPNNPLAIPRWMMYNGNSEKCNHIEPVFVRRIDVTGMSTVSATMIKKKAYRPKKVKKVVQKKIVVDPPQKNFLKKGSSLQTTKIVVKKPKVEKKKKVPLVPVTVTKKKEEKKVQIVEIEKEDDKPIEIKQLQDDPIVIEDPDDEAKSFIGDESQVLEQQVITEKFKYLLEVKTITTITFTEDMYNYYLKISPYLGTFLVPYQIMVEAVQGFLSLKQAHSVELTKKKVIFDSSNTQKSSKQGNDGRLPKFLFSADSFDPNGVADPKLDGESVSLTSSMVSQVWGKQLTYIGKIFELWNKVREMDDDLLKVFEWPLEIRLVVYEDLTFYISNETVLIKFLIHLFSTFTVTTKIIVGASNIYPLDNEYCEQYQEYLKEADDFTVEEPEEEDNHKRSPNDPNGFLYKMKAIASQISDSKFILEIIEASYELYRTDVCFCSTLHTFLYDIEDAFSGLKGKQISIPGLKGLNCGLSKWESDSGSKVVFD